MNEGASGGRSEIENLLPDEFLTENSLVSEEQIVGDKNYHKIKDVKKSKMAPLLLGADAATFSDFEPLYAKTLELFKID